MSKSRWKYAFLINCIRQVLPADSVRDIRIKLGKKFPQHFGGLTRSNFVSTALVEWRRNAEHYGSTVGPVSTRINGDHKKKFYEQPLISPHLTKREYNSLVRGLQASAKKWKQQSLNVGLSLFLASEAVQSPVLKRQLAKMSAYSDIIATEVDAMLKIIDKAA